MNKLLKLIGYGYREEAVEDNNDSSAGTGALGTGNDARLALFDKINDTNDAVAVKNGDLVDAPETDENGNPLVPVDTAEAEAAKVAAETEAARVAAEAAAAPDKYKIKVNGREQELTLDELVARAQKVEAADQYLADASRIRAELAEKNKQTPPLKDAAVESSDDALALARAIQMGTEEEAVAAIRKITAKTAPAPTTDIAKTIDERLNFNDAIAKFRKDYSDLTSDPVLNKMVLDMDADMLSKGDVRPYDDRYADIGKQVRDWVGKYKVPATPDLKVVDKVARKTEAPAVPKAAGAKTQTSVEEEIEESNSEIIAKIAASRGGPQWMTGVKA